MRKRERERERDRNRAEKNWMFENNHSVGGPQFLFFGRKLTETSTSSDETVLLCYETLW